MKSVGNILCPLFALGLSACGGSASDAESKRPPNEGLETAHYTIPSAHYMLTPLSTNPFGTATIVQGSVKAGESDYHYVNLDLFSTGDHQIWLKGLSADLDLEVIDWNGDSIRSEGCGAGNEVIYLTTRQTEFFDEGPSEMQITMRVYGKTDTAEGDFTLEFWTFNDDD